MTTKKGKCTNPACSKVGTEFVTHSAKFYCPECNQPLQEIKDPATNTFPWTGMIVVFIIGLLAFVGVWTYTKYYSKKGNADTTQDDSSNANRVVPSLPQFQDELNNVIDSSTSESNRDTLLKAMSRKYLANVYVVHIDTALESSSTRNTLKEYLQYLNVFSAKEGVSLRLKQIKVESIDVTGDSTVIKISERLQERNKR